MSELLLAHGCLHLEVFKQAYFALCLHAFEQTFVHLELGKAGETG
jgi:hypothetical protein